MSPAVAQREAAILGALLEANRADLPPDLARLLAHAPESFDDRRHGAIAVAIRTLGKQGKSPHAVSVAEALQSQSGSEGACLLLGELPNQALPMDLAELEAQPLWVAYRRRRITTLLSEASEALQSKGEQADNIAAHVRKALDDLDVEPGPTLSTRLFSPTTKPEKPTPRYFVNGIVVCTAGNITTISAQPKAGKTAFVGAMISAAVHNPDTDIDCLGIGSGNIEGKALVHFDTEQSPFDHHELIERALRRAKVAAAPAWLKSYCLTGFSIPEARRSIRRGVASAAQECGGIHSVLIDGVADLVQDVNDPAEANDFVNELHALAIEFSCPIVGVIHLNPGSDFKTRGHLGSQLERKAETNLRLEKDGEAIILWSDKNRRAPIPKNHGPRFAWSDEQAMYVSVESVGPLRERERRGTLREEATVVFDAAGKESLSWTDFHVQLEKAVRLRAGTARNHFSEMLKTGVITKNLVSHYELTQ